jgi:hypothetical protein
MSHPIEENPSADDNPCPAGQLRALRIVDDADRGIPTPPLGVNGDKHLSVGFRGLLAQS